MATDVAWNANQRSIVSEDMGAKSVDILRKPGLQHTKPRMLHLQSTDSTEAEEPVPPDETNVKKIQKRVTFLSLHIREYNQILGDHPCCECGPPVALGWEHEPERSVTIDEYEATRAATRKPKSELKLSFDDRRKILADYSDCDVRRVQRRLHRQRVCSHKSKKTFFMPQQPVVPSVLN